MDDQSLGKMKNHEISLAGRLRPGKNASRLRRKALNLLGDFLFYSTLNHEKIV
jgi:hypothetical protein